MKTVIKIILSILFLICLMKMPYGYYQLVRTIALVGFAILAYDSIKDKQIILAIIYIGLAILFQPLIKIALHRQIWNDVDIIVSIFLILSIFIFKKK